ncbi:MAG: hypothetical protein MJ252_14520, partial [archaeon]|nr:hypothetical protein [archaeon]
KKQKQKKEKEEKQKKEKEEKEKKEKEEKEKKEKEKPIQQIVIDLKKEPTKEEIEAKEKKKAFKEIASEQHEIADKFMDSKKKSKYSSPEAISNQDKIKLVTTTKLLEALLIATEELKNPENQKNVSHLKPEEALEKFKDEKEKINYCYEVAEPIEKLLFDTYGKDFNKDYRPKAMEMAKGLMSYENTELRIKILLKEIPPTELVTYDNAVYYKDTYEKAKKISDKYVESSIITNQPVILQKQKYDGILDNDQNDPLAKPTNDLTPYYGEGRQTRRVYEDGYDPELFFGSYAEQMKLVKLANELYHTNFKGITKKSHNFFLTFKRNKVDKKASEGSIPKEPKEQKEKESKSKEDKKE